MHAPDAFACGDGLRACLRGSPQPERLFMCLANTIATASHSPAPDTKAKSGGDTGAACAERLGSSPESALVDEVCGLFASGALPMFVALRGREAEARGLLSRLARVRYWRRALLLPQLRRWRADGVCHPFPGAVLLPPLLDAAEAELRAAWPAEASGSGAAEQTDGTAYAEAQEELHALVRATGSFRAICIGMDLTLRNHTRRLVRRVQQEPWREETAKNRAAAAAAFTERAARDAARHVWADIFALFSHSGTAVAARESLFVLAAALLSSHSAALPRAAPDNDAATAAVRLLIEELRVEISSAAASRLAHSRALPGAPPLSAAFDAAARHALLWKASAAAESAVAHCARRYPAAQAWARETASRVWGKAVCVARALERAATDNEENGTRAAVALEAYAERMASVYDCAQRVAGQKHRRAESSYAAEFFLRVQDASGFALLALERQDALSAALRDLHGIVVNTERAAVVASLEEVTDTREDREALLRWYQTEVHAVICRALGEEAPLLMCLLHAVFALAEREGTSSLRTRETLHGVLLTTLAHLCRDDGDANGVDSAVPGEDDAEEDTVEDYYERHQALAALLASGLLALPWDPRGLRLRLLLHNAISDAVSDAFSAEDALGAVEEIASHAKLSGHTVCGTETEAEAAAVAVCSGTRHEPALQFLLQLSAGGDVPSDEVLRAEAPTYFPAPCGALIVLAAQRALSSRLHALRMEWDEQQQRCDTTDAQEYLGRRAMFCTSRDVAVFRVLVQLAHRMAFAAQLQPRGLLRLWLSYLRDLFTRVVPPPDDDDDMTLTDPRGTWRALRRSPVESPQAELRAALGELLADLALAPLVDRPAAAAVRRWLRERRGRAHDVAALQRILPVAVLEELCAAVGLRAEGAEEGVEAYGDEAEAEGDGTRVEQSFLGVTGAVAFCRRLEVFIVPETIADERAVALLNTLWTAIDQSIAGGA